MSVKRCYGRLGFLVVAHFDEAEAFAASGAAIHDDIGAVDGAVLCEELLEIIAGNAVT